MLNKSIAHEDSWYVAFLIALNSPDSYGILSGKQNKTICKIEKSAIRIAVIKTNLFGRFETTGETITSNLIDNQM